jgi:hypothetical protein
MVNRLKKKRNMRIAVGCVFAAMCLFGAYQASAAVIGISSSASGDCVFVNSEFTWAASNGDLSQLPAGKSCGQEILMGSYGQRIMAKNAQYESLQGIGDEEIMSFSSMTNLTAGPTILREMTGIFGTDMGATVGGCSGVVNSTAYNEEARAGSSFIGGAIDYSSESIVVQADDVIPDSILVSERMTGAGRFTFSAESISQIGIGNSSAIGMENVMRYRMTSSGRDISSEGMFSFSSFNLPSDAEGEEPWTP